MVERDGFLPPPYPPGYEYLAGYEERTVDDKGRLVLPAGPWRDAFSGGARLTSWKGHLALWTVRGWGDVVAEVHAEQKLGTRPAGTVEGFRRSTQMVTIDGQGRFALPPRLRERAGIGGQGSLVAIDGQGDRLEIWALERLSGLTDDEVEAALADFEH